jgi:hypothetical protein
MASDLPVMEVGSGRGRDLEKGEGRVVSRRRGDHGAETELSVDPQTIIVAGSGPCIFIEHCTTFLPLNLVRLPELDLGEGLIRPLHSYAHGGFMGAAISMLADPDWEHILLEIVAASSGESKRAKV